jgi:peptidylprolyl isomerase
MDITKPGDQVQIHYTGRLDDGTIFDSSTGQSPLEFTAGGGEMIPGVSQAVLGMRPGESKTVTVDPEDAYGQRQPGLEKRVSRSIIPEEAEVGSVLKTQVKGETTIASVKELGGDFAILDFNHPLAGHRLSFDIELVAVELKDG